MTERMVLSESAVAAERSAWERQAMPTGIFVSHEALRAVLIAIIDADTAANAAATIGETRVERGKCSQAIARARALIADR